MHPMHTGSHPEEETGPPRADGLDPVWRPRGTAELTRGTSRSKSLQKTCLSTLGAGPCNTHTKNTRNSSSQPVLSMSLSHTLSLLFFFSF